MSVLDISQVKNWIFEHACKHSMNKIIHFILSEDQNISHKYIDPIFPFLAYMDGISLWKKSVYLKIDSSSLTFLVDLLQLTFQKVKSVKLPIYLRTITSLKILILLKELKEKSQTAHIISMLNNYFPRWSVDTEDGYKKSFHNLNERILQKIENNTKKSRNFFLDLLRSDNIKDQYLKNCLDRDFDSFVSIFKENLPILSSSLRDLLPSSAIEQIVGGGAEELIYTDDPAVQVLLDYLVNGTSEENLFLLLQELQPKTEIAALSSQLSCRFSETPSDFSYFSGQVSGKDFNCEAESKRHRHSTSKISHISTKGKNRDIELANSLNGSVNMNFDDDAPENRSTHKIEKQPCQRMDSDDESLIDLSLTTESISSNSLMNREAKSSHHLHLVRYNIGDKANPVYCCIKTCTVNLTEFMEYSENDARWSIFS